MLLTFTDFVSFKEMVLDYKNVSNNDIKMGYFVTFCFIIIVFFEYCLNNEIVFFFPYSIVILLNAFQFKLLVKLML